MKVRLALRTIVDPADGDAIPPHRDNPTPSTRDYPMIEALKDDTVIHALGGRIKFTSLVQHRDRELMDGARPLVDRRGPDGKMRSDFEVAVAEIVEGKITWAIEGQEPEPVPAALEAESEDDAEEVSV